MAWTEITRPKYRRDGLRYASDTTDEEWAVIEPHLPPPATCGRTRETDLREVVNAIFYIAQTGCQWRLLPKDFPPYTTVQRYFYAWRDRALADHQPCAADGGARSRRPRGKPDRRGDRQPVGQDHRVRRPARLCRRQDDQGPQAPYPDRHHRPAGWHDRPSGERAGSRRRPRPAGQCPQPVPWLRHVFADGGYAGDKLQGALENLGDWTIEIVKRSDAAKGLFCCRAVGSSSAPSPGSTATAAWQRMSKQPSKAP